MLYRTVLIEPERLMKERLTRVIRNTPNFELIGWYAEPDEAIADAEKIKPEIILVDIEEEKGLKGFDRLKQTFPKAILICLSRQWDSEEQARLIRAGASGYMIKPFTGAELAEAVQTFSLTHLGDRSEVITFFSPKGKSGKTTLVSNLAAAVAEKVNEPVAIIDADFQFGDQSVFLNLRPQSTITEAVRDIDFLSPVTLKSYFVKVNDNLHVLCGASKPEQVDVVTIDKFTRLINMVKSLYRYVLIDMPSGFSDSTAAACELSTRTILMTMYNGGYEVVHMRRALEIFKAWDDYEKRVDILFTRLVPGQETQEKFSQLMGYPVKYIIPNAYNLVSESADNGRLAINEDETDPFSQAILAMADSLVAHE